MKVSLAEVRVLRNPLARRVGRSGRTWRRTNRSRSNELINELIEIPLPAGPHKITLMNQAEGLKKTQTVQISVDQSTKIIEELMK